MRRQMILIAGGGPDSGRWASELRRAGFLVRESARGPRALRVLAAERPGLVIASMASPSRRGIELIESARRTDPLIAVLAATGAGDDADGQHATTAGADDLLARSASASEVLAAARRLLACEEVLAEAPLGAASPLPGC